MAAPVLQSATTTTGSSAAAGAGTFTVNLPASVAAGDLIVVFAIGFSFTWGAAPTGWTKLAGTTTAGSYPGAAYWRIAAGATSTVAVPYSAAGVDTCLAVAARITGATTVETSAANSGSASPQNAPALTAAATERLSVLLGSWQTSTNATPTATGYSTAASTFLINASVAVASRALTASGTTGTIAFNLGTGAQSFGHIHLLAAPQTSASITANLIGPIATVYTPGSVINSTSFIDGPTVTARNFVPSPGVQPPDQTVTMAAWTPVSGNELNYRSTSQFRSNRTYRPAGGVIGTRLFGQSVVLTTVPIYPDTITSSTVLWPLGAEAQDRTVPVDVIATTAVLDPGITDAQVLSLAGVEIPAGTVLLFDPAVQAGDTLIAPIPVVSGTVLWAPDRFDRDLAGPRVAPTTTLWAPSSDMTVSPAVLARTVLYAPVIGQYLVIPEPDDVIWGESGGFSARVDILDPGGRVVASTATTASGLVLVSGSVNEDISQAVVRSCQVRLLLENTADGARHPLLPAKPGDPLDPRTGGALAIYAGPIRPSGDAALVKLGVFRIVAASPKSQATGDSLDLRGLSEETVIAQTPFLGPYVIVGGTPITEVISDIVTEALPNVRIHTETAGINAPASSFAESDNRLAKVQELANAIGMTAQFDRDGRFRVESVVDSGEPGNVSPKWTFTEGTNAVMRDVGRELDDGDVYNGVIVVGEPLDTNIPPVRAELWNSSDPTSPLYYNPANPGASRMGPRPRKVVSQLVYTVEQARALAAVLMAKVMSHPDKISVTVTTNPNIEAGDIARIVRTTMGVDGIYEVQSVTHDLLGAASSAVCVARS